MDDEEYVNVRFAIVRFRSPDEPARLRLLLRQYGFDEPTWLDANGQLAFPPVADGPAIADGSCDGPSMEEPQTSSSQPSRISSVIVGPSLTLPTVLVEPPGLGWRAPQASVTSSAVLPLATSTAAPVVGVAMTAASAQIPLPVLATTTASITTVAAAAAIQSTPTTTTQSSSRSSSSHLSMFASRRPSSDCTPPSTSLDSPPPPLVSPDPPDAPAPAPAPVAAATDEAPADSGGISTATRAWVSPAPLRPRGKKPHPHEDPNVYYTCQLCKNKILGTRVSNLQNHVRRHSTLKQFQCCYCEYAHNEIAKVRLHMTNNHKDSESQPVNNLTPDMQAVWRSLFRECFPTRAQRRRGMRTNPGSSGVQSASSASSSGGISTVPSGGVSTVPSGAQSEPSDSQPSTSGIVRQSSSTSSSTTPRSSSHSSLLPLSMRRRRHHRRLPRTKKIALSNQANAVRNRDNHQKINKNCIRGNDRSSRGDDDATSMERKIRNFMATAILISAFLYPKSSDINFINHRSLPFRIGESPNDMGYGNLILKACGQIAEIGNGNPNAALVIDTGIVDSKMHGG